MVKQCPLLLTLSLVASVPLNAQSPAPVTRRIVLTVVLLLSASGDMTAQEKPGCDAPVYRQLDFWVGTWDVRLDGRDTVIGTNIIEKTLNGCAILEHWTDGNRNRSKSLFYYHRADRVWKQVWVTDVGRVKEKRMLPESSSTVVMFQGELRLDAVPRVFDRTTLTDMGDGRVRQRIAQSADGGTTWDSGFDAIYTRRPTGGK
jgi:hypothetical protein